MESDTQQRNLNISFRRRWFKNIFSKQRMVLSFCWIFILIFIGAILYSILGQDILPGSELFALILLYVLAFIGGQVFNCIWLPPLLGMLIAGFLYRKRPFIPYYKNISIRWASTFRSSAFVVILLKAGLGLDAQKLKELKAVVLQLAFIPCILETLAAGAMSYFLLKFPWMWSLLLGFVVSAVSPAVVVPSLLNLQDRHFGTNKGIPTLVIAAASVDDILAITGFTIMLSISLSDGKWYWSLAKGIIEPLAGFIFGIACGRVLWLLPGKENSKTSFICYRTTLLVCGGLAVLLMSKKLDFAGAGPFGCLVLGFVAAFQWKKDPNTFPGIEKIVSVIWVILQPFLFSLIGCEVTIASLQINIKNSILVLVVGLAFRMAAAFGATIGGNLNWKEKIFIVLAWLPKATVQAAIGPQALDYVLANNKGPEMEDLAKKVLAVAVLSIMITAPLGAVFIAILGPILLTCDEAQPEIKEQSFNLDNENSNDLQIEESTHV